MINIKDPVQVFLKTKPRMQSDAKTSGSFLQVIDESSVSLDNKLFKFDFLATEDMNQDDFFNSTMIPVCEAFISGTPVLLLTYGQTGSGKTFTLYGDAKSQGLVQHSCDYIIDRLSPGTLSCSFVEIYQENIYDLLVPTVKGLNIEEDSRSKIRIEGLHEEIIAKGVHVNDILKKASKKAGGGKAHSIFTLTAEKDSSIKFHFVDLAGNERLKGSGLTSEKFKETSNVNKSLSHLGNVIKALGQKMNYINFRDSKLTYFLKDAFFTSKIVLISTIIPSRKTYWETLNTLKFSQRVKRLASEAFSDDNIETIEYLQQEVACLQQELDTYKISELKLGILSENHSNCEKRISELQEKISTLEEENKILRKEILETNKIDNSDWLLSSDSEENENIHTLLKEKSELELSMHTLKETISEQQKKIKEQEKKYAKLEILIKNKDSNIEELKNKIEMLNKEKEDKYEDLIAELNDVKKRLAAYQDLSVLLSKQNADLISDIGRNKEMCYEYVTDLSSVSSTDSSKCEIYKIIEEKDAKVNNLLENTKLAEENLQKFKEKYFSDITAYKKQIAKLKQELSLSRSENIKGNAKAMQVLEDLKQEKLKLLNIIACFSDSPEKRKLAELKEMNAILMQNLQKKGQQVAELQIQFQDFLKDRECSQDIIEKLKRKSQKLKSIQNEFNAIKSHLSNFSYFRYKLENMPLSECIIDICTKFIPRKNKSRTSEENERLNYSHS